MRLPHPATRSLGTVKARAAWVAAHDPSGQALRHAAEHRIDELVAAGLPADPDALSLDPELRRLALRLVIGGPD